MVRLLTLLVLSVFVGSGGERVELRVQTGDCAFPATEWKRLSDIDDESQTDRRRELADVVEACDLLEGRPRARVVSLLGAPVDQGSPRWEYLIGPEEYAVDYELLVVHFGADGRVKKVGRGQT